MRHKATKKIFDLGPYLLDLKYAGVIDQHTTAVVMDNVMDRERRKLKVKIMYTSNPGLLAGNDTVAVFRMAKRVESSAEVKDSGNMTHLFVSYLNRNKKSGTMPGAAQ